MSELTRIGLLAGMSWQSSAIYYRRLNELVNQHVGGYASAPVTMHSVDFADIHAWQLADDWPAQGAYLNQAAHALQAGGAQAIALGTNTLHLVADQISTGLTVPFIDLIDIVGQKLAANGHTTVGLLATGYTMRSSLYADRLAKHGMNVLVPEPDDLEAVHQIIYSELTFGVVTDASRQRYLQAVEGLIARGAQGVILGCTEIPLLVRDGMAEVPLYDTTEIHCQVLADIIVNGVRS